MKTRQHSIWFATDTIVLYRLLNLPAARAVAGEYSATPMYKICSAMDMCNSMVFVSTIRVHAVNPLV